MWVSIKEYLKLLIRTAWWVVVVAALNITGAYLDIFGGNPVSKWPIPQWGWWTLALIGSLICPFFAFHKVRKQRDLLRTSATSPAGTWDNPYIPETTLQVQTTEYEFGTSETEGYPKESTNVLWLRVFAYFNMSNTMLLQSVWVKIDQQKIQSYEWEARTDKGMMQQPHYFKIPKSLTPGTHTAQMFVEADNKWWSSLTFQISVPKH
jgi:hypothetical protein